MDELRPKLKEILYDCAVEIRATKAALFLSNGNGRFELATEYGFRSGIRNNIDVNDPVVDRCGRGRTPFFLNSLSVEPRFAEVMYESQSDRLLAAPVYFRGQLVGVIDMRDKAQKAMFEQSDVPKAQTIADRIAALFTNKNVFGQRFITLSDMNESVEVTTEAQPPAASRPSAVADAAPRAPQVMPRPAASPAAPPPPPVAAAPKPQGVPRTAHVPRLATLILEARASMSRILMPPSPESFGEAEVQAVRDVLRAILLIPGANVTMFSAFGHMGGVQEIAARAALTDEATTFLHSKLNIWLTKRGEAGGFVRTNVQPPVASGAAPLPPIGSAQLQKVFTAPVAAGSLRGLYLTVGFASTPDRTAHELLASLLGQLQLTIEQSMTRGTVSTLRSRAAEMLLEPPFSKYPELRRHSEAVAARAESLAKFVAVTGAEAETVRLVALVHDCGMRLLDYEMLYRKRDLSPDEMSILREHVAVGAALVEPILGHDVARAVLSHHERWDGRGYPNDLAGDEIPLPSRIIQICDTYETMVSADNYQPPSTPEAALNTIAAGAGSQFDAELAHRFADMMRSRG